MVCITDLENILRILHDVRVDYLAAQEELKLCDDKTQDILHDLEIVEHTYYERANLAKELVGIRRQRREAKDATETLEPFAVWIMKNANVIKELQQILGQMRRQDERHANRIYFRRTDPKGEIIARKDTNGRDNHA